jgi:hypothetical protein
MVRILPENPESGSTLEAQVLFRGDRAERLSYQWLKNDTPIPGAIQSTLSSGRTQKGDFISVQARVSQPGLKREPVLSESVLIGNSPPVMSWVGIEPFEPTATTDLKTLGESHDRDADELSYSYQWDVNGEIVADQDGSTLPRRYFSKGDRVQVTITPFDGSDWGRSSTSPVAVIGNSPPVIGSSPPDRLEEATIYRYEVKATDPDGDPLRFSLQGKPPPGMAIDPVNGVVQWQIAIPDEAVTYVYEVLVEDSDGGGAKQEITLKYVP